MHLKLCFQLFIVFLLDGVLCGRQFNNKQTRKHQSPVIIGGVEANITDVPYQVALYHYGGFQCGGSILNEWYILTAAHCLDFAFLPPEYVTFRAGSDNNRNGGMIVTAENFTIHPHYNYMTFENDVAIVKLREPLELNNDTIVASKLVDVNFTIVNFEKAEVSGWGKIDTGRYPDQLMKVEVPVLNYEECNEIYYPIEGDEIFDNMICAGMPSKDSCNGDSGGPLTYKINETDRVQIGIVSFGPTTCGSSLGVYTYISHPSIRNFIKYITGI